MVLHSWILAFLFAAAVDGAAALGRVPPPEAGGTLHPILFMGGAGASLLQADLNRTSAPKWYCAKQAQGYRLWLYYENFLPLRLNCWIENMQLKWRDGQILDSGVSVKLVGDHISGKDISSGFAKDLWGDLLRGVADLGYSGSSPHVGALHYDWRLGPHEHARDGTFAKLRATIEAHHMSSGRRAILVTLSYGSLLMHKFLATFVDAAWKAEHVERWVSLSGTFGGTAELTRIAFYPTARDFYNLPAVLPYLTLEMAREMSNTFPSTFVQRPTFQGEGEFLLNVSSGATRRLYSKDDVADALSDSGLPGARRVLEAQAGAYVFDELAAPGVRVDCLYGVADKTISSLNFRLGFNRPATDYGYEDGDGVAPTRSLARCGEWGGAGARGHPEVSVHAIPRIGHGGTLHSPQAVDAFSRIVRGLYGRAAAAAPAGGGAIRVYV